MHKRYSFRPSSAKRKFWPLNGVLFESINSDTFYPVGVLPRFSSTRKLSQIRYTSWEREGARSDEKV